MWKWIFYSLPPSLLWRPYFLISKLFSQALTYSSIIGLPSEVPAHTPQADNLFWAIIFTCLSCLTTYNGSLLPNTLGLNTFVAVDKDPTQLSHFFFFSFWTLVFHLNTYWFQQVPHTYDMDTHLSILVHPPLSSSQSLLFLLQPTKILPSMDSLQQGWANFFYKKPDSKHFSFSCLCGLCHNYSTLFVTAWKGP